MRTLVAVAVLAFVTVAYAQQAEVKPVATTGEVMTAIVVPSSTAVFQAAAAAPKDADGWAALRAQALVLAEAGNLLMLGSRARDKKQWTPMAAAMRDAAEVTVKAANAKSATALEEAGEKLYETCEQCHQKYLPQ